MENLWKKPGIIHIAFILIELFHDRPQVIYRFSPKFSTEINRVFHRLLSCGNKVFSPEFLKIYSRIKFVGKQKEVRYLFI